MNLEILAIIVSIVGLLCQLCVVGLAGWGITWRMGKFEGRVEEQIASLTKTTDTIASMLARLDNTNGGGFARCAQHTQQITDVDRRVNDRLHHMQEHWKTLESRLAAIEK